MIILVLMSVIAVLKQTILTPPINLVHNAYRRMIIIYCEAQFSVTWLAAVLLEVVAFQSTLRYDTIKEFNVD